DRHGLLEGALAGEPEHVADGPVGREELAELGDAAVEAEHLLVGLRTVQVAFVTYDDRQARDEEGRLAGAVVEVLQREPGVLEEDLTVGPVPDAGAGAAAGD